MIIFCFFILRRFVEMRCCEILVNFFPLMTLYSLHFCCYESWVYVTFVLQAKLSDESQKKLFKCHMDHCVKSAQIRSFSGPYFPVFLVRILSVFSPNAGKYGPEKTPYLDTFHAVDARNILPVMGNHLTYEISCSFSSKHVDCYFDLHFLLIFCKIL